MTNEDLIYDHEDKLSNLLMEYEFATEDLLYLGGKAGIDEELIEDYDNTKKAAIEEMKFLGFNDPTIDRILKEFDNDLYCEDDESDEVDDHLVELFNYKDVNIRYRRGRQHEYIKECEEEDRPEVPAPEYVETQKLKQSDLDYLTICLDNADGFFKHDSEFKEVPARQAIDEFHWCNINNATIRKIYAMYNIDLDLVEEDDSEPDEEIVELFTPDNILKRIDRIWIDHGYKDASDRRKRLEQDYL